MQNANMLNPVLYGALCRAFGKVQIANPGQRYRGHVEHSITDTAGGRLGRAKVKTDTGGEEYQVCCPKCQDSRFRLWINHRWGTEMHGMTLGNLACCYNESCEQEAGFFKWLQSVVDGNWAGVMYTDAPASVEPDKLGPVALPGACVPLHELPEYHPARRYVEDKRKLDAKELGKTWGVSWCEYSTQLPPGNRLTFPIYEWCDGKLLVVGWQARYLDTATLNDAPPTKEIKKYLFPRGSKAKRTLFNGYRARNQQNLVIVCEGVFDVFTAGCEHSVGIFGKQISSIQRQMLWDLWGSKGAVGVIALDPDARIGKIDLVTELATWMQNWKKTIVLDFPTGEDVSSMGQDWVWQQIGAAL